MLPPTCSPSLISCGALGSRLSSTHGNSEFEKLPLTSDLPCLQIILMAPPALLREHRSDYVPFSAIFFPSLCSVSEETGLRTLPLANYWYSALNLAPPPLPRVAPSCCRIPIASGLLRDKKGFIEKNGDIVI